MTLDNRENDRMRAKLSEYGDLLLDDEAIEILREVLTEEMLTDENTDIYANPKVLAAVAETTKDKDVVVGDIRLEIVTADMKRPDCSLLDLDEALMPEYEWGGRILNFHLILMVSGISMEPRDIPIVVREATEGYPKKTLLLKTGSGDPK